MATMGFIQSTTCEVPTSSIIVPETFTHSIAFGQTGCGKTTSFIYPNLKKRLELGHGVLLYDYKGKEHLSVKYLAQSTGRLNDVVEIGKPWGENINLIQNMDEEELDKFFSNILSHGKDGKYWENSAKSLGQAVLKILKAIESFSLVMSKVDKDFEQGESYIQIGRSSSKYSYKYPTKRTLTSLVAVCSTFETLSSFIKGLSDLRSRTQVMIKENVKELVASAHDEELTEIKLLITELVRTRENLCEIIDESYDSLSSFGENSNENLTQNIIGSLVSPLISLSQNSFFNANSFDIVSALNRGQIVVVNTQALSDSVLESLNNSILNELTQRTRSLKLQPISVFMDEAQRILSESTDLPIDVLREAKVDIFLSTQNSALLKNKLESEKFEALMGNLVHKYYFQSSVDEELNSTYLLDELESFEHLSSTNKYESISSSTPLFIELKEKIKAELKYQKKHEIVKKFAYEYDKKPCVLEYVPRLYRDKKLILINTNTLKEQVVNSSSLRSIVSTGWKVEKLIEESIQEINQAEQDYKDFINTDEYDEDELDIAVSF
ncbi:hypothetical protein GJV85_08760 [Sulfurimonas aquatica]|uniref:Type IV secretion system coupling protein TraD DNA-binding domain-containing protein n=1 Tax=Sulfurimonas aquatica TaxID=2672570 RepID=A0A975B155_9BACT|nr:hypothetical protein [Sulfurimonas aquatica]QSZ42198.1 hypothetical protein GJV85_08760 [Sulfurimonas aquatica]